jgi:hypothetical protein
MKPFRFWRGLPRDAPVPGVGLRPMRRAGLYLGSLSSRVQLHQSSRVSVMPSSFSFRCKADRSIPIKVAVRDMLPEKRRI